MALQPNAGLRFHNESPPYPSISWLLLPFHQTFPRLDFWFHNRQFFMRWGYQPHAQPLIWRTRSHIYNPWDWVAQLYPSHWVPILVAFYDRLVGLVVSMSDYWSWGRVFNSWHFHKLKIWIRSGTGSTQPREDNWVATWWRSSGSD